MSARLYPDLRALAPVLPTRTSACGSSRSCARFAAEDRCADPPDCTGAHDHNRLPRAVPPSRGGHSHVTQPCQSRNAIAALTHELPCFHDLLAGICVYKKPIDARAA